jgi:hypothetical protein
MGYIFIGLGIILGLIVFVLIVCVFLMFKGSDKWNATHPPTKKAKERVLDK